MEEGEDSPSEDKTHRVPKVGENQRGQNTGKLDKIRHI